jgi:AcrR family transcriptional regulator
MRHIRLLGKKAGRVKNRPLRKDAELNRQRLLAAATELFAEHGLGVTLNDIAHRAGVGVGTAYRRFDNKEQVIDALFERRIEEVVALGQAALEHPDAWHGLTHFLEGWLRLNLEDRGLTEVFTNPAAGSDRLDEARDRIAPFTEAIAERAVAEGVVRQDLRGTDVFFIQLTLTSLLDRTRKLAPDLYRRYLAIFLDGIRADRALSDLPVDALTSDQTHAIMTSPKRSQPRAGAPALER